MVLQGPSSPRSAAVIALCIRTVGQARKNLVQKSSGQKRRGRRALPAGELGNGTRAVLGTAVGGAAEELQGLTIMFRVLPVWLDFCTPPKQGKFFRITCRYKP